MADPKAAAKAEQILKKTQEARKIFNLTDNEDCIQDYHSSIWNAPVYVEGHMWVTQNYICFHSSLPSITEAIPFRKVTDIEKVRAALVMAGIKVTTTDKSYTFGSFIHRDEAFNLLYYLWKHPVSYVSVDGETGGQPASGFGTGASSQPPARMDAPAGSGSPSLSRSPSAPSTSSSAGRWGATPSSSGGAGGGGGWGSSGGGGGGWGSSGGGGGGWGSSGGGGGGWGSSQSQVRAEVDVQGSRNALRMAHEIREMGIAANNTLAQQAADLSAEQIDRIEYNLANIDANLKKTDRHLRGIESVTSAIKNAWTKDETKGNNPVFTPIDRTIKVDPKTLPDVDYDILYKHKNDFLAPAILRFSVDRATVLEADTKKPLKKCVYPYTEIKQVVMRARHLHVDFRLKDPKAERLRFMTSLIQLVVNEVVMRCNSPPEVIFEPGVRKFAYGSLAVKTAGNRAPASREAAAGAGFLRSGPKYQTADLISDPEQRQKMRQVEDDLDEISDIISDTKRIAISQGREIERQTEQLSRLNDYADRLNVQVAKQNQRVLRQLNS